MGSIGAPEIMVILVVALLVLGPERLPEIARQAGRAMAELRRMSAGFQAEMRDAMKPPVMQSPATSTTPAAGPPAPAGDAGGPSSNGAATPTFVWEDLPTPNEPGPSPGPSS